VGVLGRIWKDFTEFWKSQMFWALLVSGTAFLIQWRRGLFSGSVRENLLRILVPYGAIGAVFLIGNVGRTLFLMERDALRKKRRLQRREEHRSATATSKIPVTPPNLNYRRVFLDKVFVGHEISGHSYEAYVVEIGNELGSYEIGIARRIRAHLTYLDKKNEVLHRICPARWRTQEDEISIRQGESDFLVVAWNKGVWTSDLFGSGIQMPEYSKIEVRLIDLEGKDLLAEPLVFEFRAARYGNSSCVKL